MISAECFWSEIAEHKRGYRAQFADRLRPINQAAVERLAGSMLRVGLLQPISVYRPDHGSPVLVTGAHRLVLGWKSIDAVFVDGDEIELELHELAENLHRAELTQQVARWIELKSAKQVSRQVDAKAQVDRPEGGTRAAAREIGVSDPDASRVLKVASISEEAAQAARDAYLADNRSALLDAANESTPAAKVAKVGEIASAKINAKSRKVEVTNTAPREGNRLDAAELESLARAVCVGVSAFDPIVDKIRDDVGVEEFLRQISLSARSELLAVLHGLWRLGGIHKRAVKLLSQGKLDFGIGHDDDDAVATPPESESSVAAPRAPEKPATTGAAAA
jgi:ParB-like chromosome segregation protein Spo0J